MAKKWMASLTYLNLEALKLKEIKCFWNQIHSYNEQLSPLEIEAEGDNH